MGNGKAVQKVSEYLPLRKDNANVQAVVEANIGGEALGAFDLERIKLPTGGSLNWQLPDGKATPAIECIIAAWQNCRGYWPDAFSGGTPPACSSPNGQVGVLASGEVGAPGGDCRVCPMAQWSSAQDGRGQACKAMRRLFILRPGLLLPQLLTLPPTSLKASRQYFVRLVGLQLPYWAVITSITLKAAKSGGGIDYAQAEFSLVRELKPGESEKVAEYAKQLSGLMATPVATADYEGGADL